MPFSLLADFFTSVLCPGQQLSYNAVLQAYEVDITDEQLHDAPFYVGDLEFDWGDRSREVSIHKVYRTAHYWE